MKIKTNSTEQLHRFREREFQLIFQNCPDDLFSQGLEIGAGDGFQSRLLKACVKNLVCTELNEEALQRIDLPGVEYRVCDAEKIDQEFSKEQFDLVFSSNLLEHLPNIDNALKAVHHVLKENGITIHAMPNCFWKTSHLMFFYPNLMVRIFESLTDPKWLKKFRQKSDDLNMFKGESYKGNNLKVAKEKQISPLQRILWPYPHGVSANNWKEFWAFSQKRWRNLFQQNGFELVAIKTSPFSSGYRFGFNRLRKIIEFFGIGSEYIYIGVKKGHQSPYTRYILAEKIS